VLAALSKLESQTQLLNSHSQSISKLETQVGQLANTLNRRMEGTLPSQPVVNPKGQYMIDENTVSNSQHDQFQAITVLRSGKTVDNKVEEKKDEESEPSKWSNQAKDKGVMQDGIPTSEVPYVPKAPFPKRLRESTQFGKQGEKIQDMLEIFKQVKINIPLLDAIKQIPSYSKFLKDLCTQKRKTKNHTPKKVMLTEQVSSLLKHSIPPKFKDPGAPTISCTIGDHKIGKALIDLGAMYLQVGLGELMPTTVILQLADRSVKKPRGIIEDVIIQVDKFYFPVDFIVLYTKPVPNPDKMIPNILGLPFLATTNACINCRTGIMEIAFGNMKVKLNIFNAFQQPSDTVECSFVDLIDESVEELLPRLLMKDPLKACLNHFSSDNFDVEQYIGEVQSLLDSAAPIDCPPWKAAKEALPLTSGTPPIPSLESPPKLELKPLADKLKYAFLGSNETLPVIIAFDLQEDQESELISVLKEHKEAIGWTLADLKGIDPSICMHRIHLEDDAKPSREAQRRLNPNMKEVVMKEVVKLLNAGMIYPISDSKWVSPIHVVPKRSRVTVVKNKNNELIPTRVQSGWRVCIDYRKLNSMTRKDHFPLPFIDQMVERLAGLVYYCFLDGYSSYNQVPMDPED
jgi:hypothetical protein